MTSREHIVAEAMQMFVAQGIKAVRMDDIAQRLSMSKRTLYELFGDKEGLLYEAMERFFSATHDRWHEKGSRAENLIEALYIVLDDVMEHEAVSHRLIENLAKFYPAVYEKLASIAVSRSRAELYNLLKTGMEKGLFINTFNIDLAIEMLHYTATGVQAQRVHGQRGVRIPDGMTERGAFLQILTSFFRGIATSEGMKLIDRYVEQYGFQNEQK